MLLPIDGCQKEVGTSYMIIIMYLNKPIIIVLCTTPYIPLMVLYRGIWRCIGVYGDVWGCMVLYMGIWCCIGVYGDVKGCMVMYGDV